MGDILMKTRLLTLLATLVSAVSFGAPLWVDTPNNTVTFPGTMVSEQTHSDYAQLAIKPDIVQLVSNSAPLWTTNFIDSTAIDFVALDNGTIVAVDNGERFYVSMDGFRTYKKITYDAAWIRSFGYPTLLNDTAGNIYMCVTTGNEKRVVGRISRDCGYSWSDIFSSTNTGASYPNFAVSERGDIAILGGRKDSESTNLYLAVSQDRGSSWAYIYPTWQAKPYFIEEATPGICYAGNGVFVGVASYYDNSGVEIFRSSDYGTSWARVYTNQNPSGESYPIFIRGGANGRVALQIRQSRMLMMSKDYGVTWSNVRSFASNIGGAVNLYGSHWMYNLAGALKYTPDDFASEYALTTLTASGSDYQRYGPVMNKNCILVGDKFSAGSTSAVYVLNTSSFKTTSQSPVAVPIISTPPVAYMGGLYSDGVSYYRCTNGTTWTSF